MQTQLYCYSLPRARDPVAPQPLTAAAGPSGATLLAPPVSSPGKAIAACPASPDPALECLLDRLAWMAGAAVLDALNLQSKHSRTLLHLLVRRFPLSEWPRCSSESAAHETTVLHLLYVLQYRPNFILMAGASTARSARWTWRARTTIWTGPRSWSVRNGTTPIPASPRRAARRWGSTANGVTA